MLVCERGCFSVEVFKNFAHFTGAKPTYTFTIHHNMNVDHCSGNYGEVLHLMFNL